MLGIAADRPRMQMLEFFQTLAEARAASGRFFIFHPTTKALEGFSLRALFSASALFFQIFPIHNIARRIERLAAVKRHDVVVNVTILMSLSFVLPPACALATTLSSVSSG